MLRLAPAAILALFAAESAAQPLFDDLSRERLPRKNAAIFTMDAAAGDVDGDGDLDLVLALEFRQNVLLLNDGAGKFSVAPGGGLPDVARDSEDAALGDLDGDGDLDLMVVSEDDREDELYLNDGAGRFTAAPGRLPVPGRSNSLALADLDGDGDLDALIGNNGPDMLWLNDGGAGFTDASAGLLPLDDDVTQHIALGDIDGDGDLDLAVANEGPNRILVNLGGGRFRDETATRMPGQGDGGESRDAELADLDGDGDLDLIFANVQLFDRQPAQNRIWINDGAGRFADETTRRLPIDVDSTMDIAVLDLDSDGDRDLVAANFGDLSGETYAAPYRAYLNDGTGRFAPADILPRTARGNGMHVEAADFDGDGRAELFIASRGGPDVLLVPALR